MFFRGTKRNRAIRSDARKRSSAAQIEHSFSAFRGEPHFGQVVFMSSRLKGVIFGLYLYKFILVPYQSGGDSHIHPLSDF